MPTAEMIAIIGSVLGVGLGLAVLIMRSTARVDADRRALQSAMDTFRTEMMRLAERQSRLEAIQEVGARAHGTGDRRSEGAAGPSPATA